jgi:Zn-dependent protease
MLFLAKVLVLLPGLVLGITIHEAAHALTAKWLGDSLPQRLGRISLNPFRHLSPWGTLALFVLGFGWGKPVPVNLYNFKRPKLDYLLCSLAGPVSNILLCAVLLGLLFLKPGELIRVVLIPIFLINAILAVINLLPIPPLDGSKIWPCVIPGMRPVTSGKWSTVWVVVLIAALYSGAIDKVMLPVMDKMNVVLHSVLDYSSRPAGFSEVLIAPQGAYLKYHYVYPRKDPNVFGLSFKIAEPYPAKQLISFLEENLTRHKYRQLSYQLSDPNKPAENCWLSETKEDVNVYVFKQRWVNKEGELVLVNVSYVSDAKKKNGMSSAKVKLGLYKEFSSSERLSEYKQFHPEEFEGGSEQQRL